MHANLDNVWLGPFFYYCIIISCRHSNEKSKYNYNYWKIKRIYRFNKTKSLGPLRVYVYCVKLQIMIRLLELFSLSASYHCNCILDPGGCVSWTLAGQLQVNNIQSLHNLSHARLTHISPSWWPPSLQCHSSTDHRDEGYFTRPAWLLPVWGKRLGTDNPCYHIYSGWARWCRQFRSAQRDDGCFGWAEKWAAAHQRATGATSESTGYVWGGGGWSAHLLHAPMWSSFYLVFHTEFCIMWRVLFTV